MRARIGRRGVVVISTGVLVVAAAVVVPLVLLDSGPSLAPLPPTAGQVAVQLGATGFTDCGSAALYSIDSGSARWQGRRIAINTFGNQLARDAWLKIAEPYGVAPFREGSTWVAYVALHQAGAACP